MTPAPTNQGDGPSAVPSGTTASVRDAPGASVGSAVAALSSAPVTSRPTGSVDAGSAKPQSSSPAACCQSGCGRCSPSSIVTTSRRPLRLAAPMYVCRAVSVYPVFPPIAPG